MRAIPGKVSITFKEDVTFSFVSGSTTATGGVQNRYDKIKSVSATSQQTQTQYGETIQNISATIDNFGDLQFTITLGKASTRTYTATITLNVTLVFQNIIDYLVNTPILLVSLYPSSQGRIQTITVLELDEQEHLRDVSYDIQSSSK